MEWVGDEIESVRAFEIDSQGSTQALDGVTLPPVEDASGDASPLDYLARGALLMLEEPTDLQHIQYRHVESLRRLAEALH